MKLRPYQVEAIGALYAYFEAKGGNPIVDTPTGSGKSVILAGFIARALADYPATRIIVLTHVKELIEQDVAAILHYWPGAPVGIWSAGLKRREVGQVTVAGIASVHARAGQFSPCDIVIIDECHLLSRKADTMYRRFLYALKELNPALKVIGLSATPYRLDSGLLTQGEDAIFTDFAYSANVADLIADGYLSTLVSKRGMTRADLTGLHRRGGDFIPAELADRMDQVELIRGAAAEMVAYGQGRKSWLVFCSGVAHARHVAECLNEYDGIDAAMVCGETPPDERAHLLAEFKAGRLRALTNADVLTTGFDHPGVDLIAMLRPTDSIGLYVQILGRGLRPVYAPGYDLDTRMGRLAAIANGPKPNCLVLDFTANVETHGPIDCIKINHRAKGKGEVSIAPAKECPSCHALIHASIMECPECGHEWPVLLKHTREAGSGALLSAQVEPVVHEVSGVRYARHVKPGKPPSLRAEYRTGLLTFSEYVPLEDPRDYVRKHAVRWFWARGLPCPDTVDEALAMTIPAPATITVRPDGKYFRVTAATFDFA